MVTITHKKKHHRYQLSIGRQTIKEPVDTITVENQSKGYWNR